MKIKNMDQTSSEIHRILELLNANNGTKYKLQVLNEFKDNASFKRILKLAYDKVDYRFYLTSNAWRKGSMPEFDREEVEKVSLEEFMDFLEQRLATRAVTGHEALNDTHIMLDGLSPKDRELAFKIINRDLRINVGTTQINKVFGELITKPAYMRCDTYSAKTAKNIKFPAVVQLKADGTYREMRVTENGVEFTSRSGESYDYTFADHFANLPHGHYVGEMTVEGTANRAEGNGLLNSDEPPMDRIRFHVWDFIESDEYQVALKKGKNKTTYKQRLAKLKDILADFEHPQLELIESFEVQNLDEAVAHVQRWMSLGLEGGILKDYSGVFKNGTSKQQLKMKIAFTIGVRITGFIEGTPGTKREQTFGSLTYQTDDGKIRGNVSGGLSDALLEEINSDRGSFIGKIIDIEGNDLTRGRDHDYYAVSHPRLIEIRDDDTDTDDFKRAMDSLEMAKSFR
jgi:DNA ligase-1